MNSEVLILVVDDAADCVSTLELAFARIPEAIVSGAPSAEKALDILESQRVSGVITDLQLPAMSGMELIARIRSSDKHRDLPVLVISADPDPSAPAAALRAGANAFFAKPFSPGAVRKKLEELIHASSTTSSP
jgi:two-component system, chemotaxis family, chemotaxis protein CheY